MAKKKKKKCPGSSPGMIIEGRGPGGGGRKGGFGGGKGGGMGGGGRGGK